MVLSERTKGILQLAGAIVIIALALYLTSNIQQYAEFGYIGVFIISLISSATILLPAPGWAAVVAMGAVLNPYYVGILAGIGSAIGEVTAYGVGSGTVNLLDKHLGSRSERFKGWIKRYDALAIGFLAFLPNPFFDIAGLAAGSLRIPLWRFLAACMVGRILRYVILAYLGAFTLHYI